MDPATIAIVTMTWARTRDEEDVALPYIHPCPPISGGFSPPLSRNVHT